MQASLADERYRQLVQVAVKLQTKLPEDITMCKQKEFWEFYGSLYNETPRRKEETMPDYTEIRDDRVRSKICELMSEMLDNPDEHGIYPTSRFMWEMETFILAEIDTARLRTAVDISNVPVPGDWDRPDGEE